MFRSARTPLGVLCAALSVLSLESCSGTGGKREAPAGKPQRGGVFKLIHQGAPETLDPQKIVFLQDWEIASLVYEGLTGGGATAHEIRPALAERWEQFDGGRRWVFHLRRDARFHDDPCFRGGRGRKLAASDVVYTVERMAHPATNCANAYLLAGKIDGIDEYRAGRARSISGLSAMDDARVEVRLTKPYAAFLKILASQSLMVVPREAVEYYGAEFSNHPVGTGPFSLVQRKPLERYTLARNAHYWGKDSRGEALPYLDGVEIAIRPDANESVMLASLLKGDTYLFETHEKLLETLRSDPSQTERFRVVAARPPISLRFLGFSLDTGSPWARHAELRRAVAMAYDRAELVRLSPQVRLILADTLVPAPFLKRAGAWHRYDPAAARAVFEQYRKEIDKAPPVLGVNFDSEDVNLLSRNLAAASVKARRRLRPVEYYEFIVRERPDIFRVSFTPSFLDAEDYYCLFYSRSSKDVNLTGYRNEEYDRTLEAAMGEMNADRRAELYMRLEEILRRDVPAIYLNHGTPSHLLSPPHVRGVALKFVVPDLTEAWLEKGAEPGRKKQPSP